MIKNKTHKLIITAAVAATLCVGGSAYFLASANNTFANNGANTEITAEEAKKIALEKAGEGYTIEKIEIDKNLFNSEYELELKNDTYEIDAEIDASTGKITKWNIEVHDDDKDNLDDSSVASSEATSSQSVQASNNNTANKSVISESKAKEIALAKAGNGYKITSIELDGDDEALDYDIELTNGAYEIDAELDAYTGNILKWEKEKDDDTNKTNVQPSTNNTINKSVIGESKAKEIALAKAGSGYTVTSIGLDRDDNELDYDIELKNGSKEIDVEIDAYTGKVLKWEVDTSDDIDDIDDNYDRDDDDNDEDKAPSSSQSSKKLSADEVKQIALNKAGSGYKVTEIELDEDDGVFVYELELINGNYEISAKINAGTGAIIEWDRELDD